MNIISNVRGALLQIALLDEEVFGGHEEGDGSGAREKRLLKLKALGLGAGLKAAGAGLKAAGAGVKAIGVTAAKAVGKKALKVGVAVGATVAKGALAVGATVAKAAITVGIAKLLLSLLFGVRYSYMVLFLLQRIWR